MRPVCTKCKIFMKCMKNSYVVGTPTGRRWDSDRFECEECGASVAILAKNHHPEPAPLNSNPVETDCMLKPNQ